MGKETEEEVSGRWKKEEAKEENETVILKRRCVNLVWAESFDIFCQEVFFGKLWFLGRSVG